MSDRHQKLMKTVTYDESLWALIPRAPTDKQICMLAFQFQEPDENGIRSTSHPDWDSHVEKATKAYSVVISHLDPSIVPAPVESQESKMIAAARAVGWSFTKDVAGRITMVPSVIGEAQEVQPGDNGTVLRELTQPDALRLHLGEMSAQELRTAQAAVRLALFKVSQVAQREQSKALRARIEELEEVCAEAYQVVGTLSDDCGRFGDDQVQKALDNLSEQKMVHKDVLPFPSIEEVHPVGAKTDVSSLLKNLEAMGDRVADSPKSTGLPRLLEKVHEGVHALTDELAVMRAFARKTQNIKAS